jgi:hypothetical protein
MKTKLSLLLLLSILHSPFSNLLAQGTESD